MKRAGSIVALLTLAMFSAGCGSAEEGDALPVPGGQSQGQPDSGTSAPSGSGAPKVASPVDASTFEDRPCDVLTEGQAGELAIAPAGKPDVGNAEGPLCEWKTDDTTVQFWFVTGQQNGLAGLYELHELSPYRAFEVVPDVAGQPAMIADAVPLRDGRCLLSVGLTDQQIIGIQVSAHSGSPHYKDTCDFSHDAAEAMVTTMKGGA